MIFKFNRHCVSRAAYIVEIGKAISEYWIGKDMKESRLGPVRVIIQNSSGATEENCEISQSV
jgi:hypothetical protein